MVWTLLYRDDAAEHVSLIEDARGRAASGLDFLESGLGEKPYLLGDEFSAADIMTGFTLGVARALGVLDERTPRLLAYAGRLEATPAYQKALTGA
jgi:glutathione S-transferase